MTRLPRITGRELVAALGQVGFLVARVKGSHHLVRHADGRATVVPVHAGETLGPGLLARILADVQLTRDELAGLL
jgi:predicted RNA binding protein YcfA (HicA-like mRNA interferase family)